MYQGSNSVSDWNTTTIPCTLRDALEAEHGIVVVFQSLVARSNAQSHDAITRRDLGQIAVILLVAPLILLARDHSTRSLDAITRLDLRRSQCSRSGT